MWRQGKDRSTIPERAAGRGRRLFSVGGYSSNQGTTAVQEPEAKVFSSVPTITGFRDMTVIGHGSTATVYRATQDGFDRDVAVKVLHLDISDRRAQKRFQRERSLNGRLSNHPNVVTILDSGFVDGRHPYLVMEYLEEGSLADRLKQRGPFDLVLTMHIGVRIAGALESAHRVGVLHRDVKPNNILLSRLEEPALADFGIAAILEMEQSYTAALTPVHAAPELLEGAEPSPQTDVYALGSTLYTLLAGAAPFAGPAGEGMLSQLLRITTSDVPSLARDDTPRELIDLLRHSLAKRPEARLASAVEFGERLQELQQRFNLPISVLPVDGAAKSTPATNTSPASVTTVVPKVVAPPLATPVLPPVVVPVLPPLAVPKAVLPLQIPRENAATVTFEPQPPNVEPFSDPDLTISARQLHPPQPAVAQRKRRWWVLPVVIGGSVATVGIVTVLALGQASDKPTGTSLASIVTVPVSTQSTTVDYSRYVPTNVLVAVQDGALSVRFGDHTDGKRQHLVKIGRGPTKPVLDPVITQEGESYLVLPPEIDPAEPICVVVAAVVELPDKFAESAPVCINGGKTN